MKSVADRIEMVFKKVFSVESSFELERNLSPDWDSLKHIELVLELEDEFLIELSSDQSYEIIDFSSCLRVITEIL